MFLMAKIFCKVHLSYTLIQLTLIHTGIILRIRRTINIMHRKNINLIIISHRFVFSLHDLEDLLLLYANFSSGKCSLMVSLSLLH